MSIHDFAVIGGIYVGYGGIYVGYGGKHVGYFLILCYISVV